MKNTNTERAGRTRSLEGERGTVASSTAKARGAKSAKRTPAQSRKFAEGLCFKKLFFIFLIGSVLGAIYEDILVYVTTLVETGTGQWVLHRGVIYGPFNVIYGFGAALMCWLLIRRPFENWQIFLLAAGLGGFVEYALSYLQELVTHTTSWDYSDLWLNIGGRTTIPIMLVWGLMGLVLVKVVYPLVSRMIERIPIRTGEILFVCLLVFMLGDMLVSWSAVFRRALRHNNVPAFTPVGEFLDEHYPDEVLVRYYPNMEWADKK